MKYLNDVSYKDCVGKVFKSKSSGYFKILKYNDKTNVEIQFLNTGYETVADYAKEHNGMLVAFWDKQSKGTKGMIDYATKIGLKSVVMYYNVGVSDVKTN